MTVRDTSYREVAVDPVILDSVSRDAALWSEPPETEEDKRRAAALDEQRAEAIALLGIVIESKLTRRQREIVDLYFYRGKTQQEVAEILGISQQVVSKQLFGVMRAGKKVGGAIRRLQKEFRNIGITFD